MQCYEKYSLECIKFTKFVSWVKHQDLTIFIKTYGSRIYFEIHFEKKSPFTIEIWQHGQKTLNRLKHLNMVLTGHLTVYIDEISYSEIPTIKKLASVMFHNRNSISLVYQTDQEIILLDRARSLRLIDNFSLNQFKKMLEFMLGLAYQYRLSQILVNSYAYNFRELLSENYTINGTGSTVYIIEF